MYGKQFKKKKKTTYFLLAFQAQLIRKYGYQAESHQIETEDGYLLTLHRIPGNETDPTPDGKPIVLLQHGILGSSADWVMLGPNYSLGTTNRYYT